MKLGPFVGVKLVNCARGWRDAVRARRVVNVRCRAESCWVWVAGARSRNAKRSFTPIITTMALGFSVVGSRSLMACVHSGASEARIVANQT